MSKHFALGAGLKVVLHDTITRVTVSVVDLRSVRGPARICSERRQADASQLQAIVWRPAGERNAGG